MAPYPVLTRVIRAIRDGTYFGAAEAAIFSKRGSPRRDPMTASVSICPSWGLARMERAKPIVVQTFDVVVTAEELLLRQTCRRSYTYSGEVARTYINLDEPKLLCARPDIHVPAWAVSD